MADEKIEDDPVTALRKLVYETALNAVKDSEAIREMVVELQRTGNQIRLDVCVAIRNNPPDWEKAEKRATQRRKCPCCSTGKTPFWMRGRVVRERVKGEDDHEAMEGPQVRFACSLCGYGEVEPIEVKGA